MKLPTLFRNNIAFVSVFLAALVLGEAGFLYYQIAHTKPVDTEFVIEVPFEDLQPGQDRYVKKTLTIKDSTYFVSFAPDMTVSPRMLHHGLLFYRKGEDVYCPHVPPLVFSVGSEIKTALLPPGYGFLGERGEKLTLVLHLTNPTQQVQKGSFILRIKGEKHRQPAQPVLLSIADYCSDANKAKDVPSEYVIPPEFSHHEATMQRPFIVPKDGMLVGWGGHLHQYGTSLSILHNGKAISTLTPGKNPRTDVDPESVYLERQHFQGIPLKKGDMLDLQAIYDKPAGLFYPGAMGLGYTFLSLE